MPTFCVCIFENTTVNYDRYFVSHTFISHALTRAVKRATLVYHEEVQNMNRRQFFATSAALAAVAACEQRRVRLWLVEAQQGDVEPWLRTDKPSTYRDVAAERLVPSLKVGDPFLGNTVHRAGDLEAGDALMRRRIKDGDPIRLWEQIWVVCRVEVLS